MFTILVALRFYGEVLVPGWAACWVLGLCLIADARSHPWILATSLWVVLTFAYGVILECLTWGLYHHSLHFTWHVSGLLFAACGVAFMIVSLVPLVHTYRLERRLKAQIHTSAAD